MCVEKVLLSAYEGWIRETIGMVTAGGRGRHTEKAATESFGFYDKMATTLEQCRVSISGQLR